MNYLLTVINKNLYNIIHKYIDYSLQNILKISNINSLNCNKRLEKRYKLLTEISLQDVLIKALHIGYNSIYLNNIDQQFFIDLWKNDINIKNGKFKILTESRGYHIHFNNKAPVISVVIQDIFPLSLF